MPFCISCGAENPEGAKFCAKCGAKQETEAAQKKPADLPMPSPPPPAASPPAASPKSEGEPAPPVEPAAPITLKPKPAPEPPAAKPPPTAPPAQKPAPTGPVTAKEALKSTEVKPQKGSAKEPIPGAPGQTQFFMAAAQVSTGAKIRRVLIFVLGAIILGTGLFLLIRFAMQQQEAKRETMVEKPAAAAPVAGESQDGGTADGTAGTAADAGKAEAEAEAEEKKPTEEEKKPTKKKKKKKRRRRTR